MSTLNVIKTKEKEEEKRKIFVEEAHILGEELLFEWHPNSQQILISIRYSTQGHIFNINHPSEE